MNKSKVKILDKNLAKVIRKKLGIKYRQPTVSEMETIKELRCYDVVIKDLTGLEYATNLRELSIYTNKITDFTTISKLSNLRRIFIYLYTGFDINIIANLTHLNTAELSWERINNFVPYSKYKTKISYTFLLNKVFEAKGFTNKQRRFIEEYIMNPSEHTAVAALKITPRANMFVKEHLTENEIDEVIKTEISNSKVHLRYLRELGKMPEYKSDIENYIYQYGSNKAKKWYMEKELMPSWYYTA